MTKLPLARQARLVIQELPEEVLVYDLVRDKAHCLNQTAAFIWKQCDGQTTIAETRARMEKAFGANVDDEVIWLALDQLKKFDLLQSGVNQPPGVNRLSRRALMGSIAAAAIALPLVTSISIPAVHAFSSCAKNGDPCFGNGNCCSNNCEATAGGGPGTCAP